MVVQCDRVDDDSAPSTMYSTMMMILTRLLTALVVLLNVTNAMNATTNVMPTLDSMMTAVSFDYDQMTMMMVDDD